MALLEAEEDRIADSLPKLLVVGNLQYVAMVIPQELTVGYHMKAYVVGWCSAKQEGYMAGYQVEERIGRLGY